MNDINVHIYDIETLKEMFLIGIYNVNEDTYYEFEVSKERNSVDGFVNYLDRYKDDYFVGYNNIGFDMQVCQHIVKNWEFWHELTYVEINNKIYQCAQDVIHDRNYNVFPKYREEDFIVKQLDLFKIAHYDNKNRMVSLKRLQFEMDYENIEEMPIYHGKENLSPSDIELTRVYCKNDVMSTYEFYKILRGDTNHPEYKGKDSIQLRFDIQEEYKINCLNYSDSKIGDEIIKKYYCEVANKQYYDLPKKGYFRKEVKVKNCIADYVKFETPQLKKFLKNIKFETLTLTEEFKKTIDFYNVKYTLAKGGLHSVNKPEIYQEDDEYLIVDYDVSSYYPAIIINNNRYPAHLGKEFLVGYKRLYEERLKLKPQAKSDPRIAGIVGALKLAVNSVYGKSSDMQNWIYDRQLTMFTTITGELSLMMLIEKYELNDINVISANTDGVTIRVHKDKMPKVEEINKWWCDTTDYLLERTDYKKIIFSTVNDYMAILPEGKVKKKGDFLTDFELHKNKSARIVPIALEQYYVNDIPVGETIKNHKNIYDFCLRQKANRNFHYEGINNKTNIVTKYDKLIRYYISNDGEEILKMKNENCDTNAPLVSRVHAGGWLCTVCNYLPSGTNVDDCDINYTYYIHEAEKMIRKIQYKGSKPPTYIKNQLSLF